MRPYLFILCLLASQLVLGQANFSAVWSFNNTTGGSSSHANVGTGGADLMGVVLNNLASYIAGQNGQAANIGGWSQTGGCNFGEYVQVTVQPLNGQRLSLNSLSFFVERSSSAGPPTIRVRSSIDGFSGDIAQLSTSTNYQAVSSGLGGNYANQTGAISFRIYACPPHTGGTIHLDHLVINGTVTVAPLPVSLLYFRAQPQPDNRVTLAWATTWEREADRFEIQRGRNLSEFGTIGQVSARGTTDSRQLYTFSDDWPDGGTTYYRLRQVDHDGSFTYSDPVAAVLDDETPTLQILETGLPNLIRLKGRNLSGATFSVISPTGQLVPVSVRPEPDGAIGLEGNFGPGMYLIRADVRNSRLTQRALVLP
jgi:hypothetical protein